VPHEVTDAFKRDPVVVQKGSEDVPERVPPNGRHPRGVETLLAVARHGTVVTYPTGRAGRHQVEILPSVAGEKPVLGFLSSPSFERLHAQSRQPQAALR
jgi:hypothetical protein